MKRYCHRELVLLWSSGPNSGRLQHRVCFLNRRDALANLLIPSLSGLRHLAADLRHTVPGSLLRAKIDNLEPLPHLPRARPTRSETRLKAGFCFSCSRRDGWSNSKPLPWLQPTCEVTYRLLVPDIDAALSRKSVSDASMLGYRLSIATSDLADVSRVMVSTLVYFPRMSADQRLHWEDFLKTSLARLARLCTHLPFPEADAAIIRRLGRPQSRLLPLPPRFQDSLQQ